MSNDNYFEKVYDINNKLIEPGDLLSWKKGHLIKYRAVQSDKTLKAVPCVHGAVWVPEFCSRSMSLMVIVRKGNGEANGK